MFFWLMLGAASLVVLAQSCLYVWVRCRLEEDAGLLAGLAGDVAVSAAVLGVLVAGRLLFG